LHYIAIDSEYGWSSDQKKEVQSDHIV